MAKVGPYLNFPPPGLSKLNNLVILSFKIGQILKEK